MSLDQEKLNQFLQKALGDFGATYHAALVVIGDKLGLYKALADAGPLTPAELAERTGTAERYVARMAGRPGGRRLRHVRSYGWPLFPF
jgi:ParB-like chromosome segregation protein Spo0J